MSSAYGIGGDLLGGGMAGGWLIGVMVELAGEAGPLRHFYAVGHEDQGKSEWTAVDEAMRIGAVAASPTQGVEPVQAIGRISPQKMQALGLKPGQLRALGQQWPRRWAPVITGDREHKQGSRP